MPKSGTAFRLDTENRSERVKEIVKKNFIQKGICTPSFTQIKACWSKTNKIITTKKKKFLSKHNNPP
jgi:hypothetical protein